MSAGVQRWWREPYSSICAKWLVALDDRSRKVLLNADEGHAEVEIRFCSWSAPGFDERLRRMVYES